MTTAMNQDVDLGTDRDFGVIVKPDTLRFERVLPGPIERVWTYLTDPDKVATWLAAADSQMRSGATVVFTWNHGKLSPQVEPTPERYEKHQGATSRWRVTRFEPPRAVGWTWNVGTGSESDVMVELTPLEKDVLLVLTHSRIRDPASIAEMAAGWHTHLAILEDNLRGRVPRPFWSTQAAAQADYEKRFSHPSSAR